MRLAARAGASLIVAVAVFVSPLGYLAIPLIGGWAMTAARALF